LTITADKLATITNSAYTIINQTGNGAALDLAVNYNGAEYGVGESITINDVVYNITNGDGNDIAIKAAAKILTVNSAYTEDTPGFGFSKFNKFEDALQAASSEATAIKLESDVTVDSEIGYYNLPADLSIIADEHVTLDMAGNSFYPMGKKTLVVGENVAIANMGQMIAYESRVILNGDFAGSHLWTFGWNGNAENGATGLTINETSKVTVATQLEFRGGDVTINGNITDTSAALAMLTRSSCWVLLMVPGAVPAVMLPKSISMTPTLNWHRTLSVVPIPSSRIVPVQSLQWITPFTKLLLTEFSMLPLPVLLKQKTTPSSISTAE
jgi:hypothetical protein